MPGFPDWQRITEWIGPPLVTGSAFAIGAGSHTDGPFPAGSWASVVLAIKPTGGAITATVRQAVAGGPASLLLDTVIPAGAGAVVIESVPLLAANVSLILQGAAAGETVDYALSPANTTTRSVGVGGAQVITGSVAANGTITQGTGFTVNRTGAGVYVVTFTTAFPAAPDVLVTPLTATETLTAGVSSVSGSGATINIFGAANNHVDRDFNFLAYTMA